MVTEPSKAIKRQLRQLAEQAYQEELKRALMSLQKCFELWQKGKLSSDALDDEIHKYHQGPSRDIYARYKSSYLKLVVARAIALGIIPQETVPEGLYSFLAQAITLFEEDAES